MSAACLFPKTNLCSVCCLCFLYFAPMKPEHLILFFVAFLAACSSRHTVLVEEAAALMPCTELCAIDSLMWRQPDSALAVLLDFALDKQQILDLRLAADRHFNQFTVRLKQAYPKLTNGDLDYCCLYLLGLNDADIAALMQRTYNTVFERNGKMRKIFGSEIPLPVTLTGLANEFLSD